MDFNHLFDIMSFGHEAINQEDNGYNDNNNPNVELSNDGGIVLDHNGLDHQIQQSSETQNVDNNYVSPMHLVNPWDAYHSHQQIPLNPWNTDTQSHNHYFNNSRIDEDSLSFKGYYYTGPNGEKLYKAGDGHVYDINGNKVL